MLSQAPTPATLDVPIQPTSRLDLVSQPLTNWHDLQYCD